jgi:hypothetical protein
MEPVSATIAAIVSSAKVVEAVRGFASGEACDLGKESASAGFRGLLHRLQPTVREKAARQAVRLFAEEWARELEDKCRFEAAIPGYLDQLGALIETATPEIAQWMDPEVRKVDLHRVETTWTALGLDSLPGGFDWELVARNYGRAIREYIKKDPELRAAYDTVLAERTLEAAERTASAAERTAGPAPGFDVELYRKFLIEKKCNAMQLSALDFSTYAEERRVTLWSVFVPQSARESAPVVEVSPEVMRDPDKEEHTSRIEDDSRIAEMVQRYRSIPIRPVLQIIDPAETGGRNFVITGDPGAGKSSLLKYLALRWANGGSGPLPLIIDLKEYGKRLGGLLKYCQSGATLPRLDSNALDGYLRDGLAGFYLDGLDEIFDQAARQTVVEEIATLSAEYPRAAVFVTSRKVGYKPERLDGAGFVHVNLEDFSQEQILAFLGRWYEIAEDEPEKRGQLTLRLASAIADSVAIRELAGNPLLLTMMAILNRSQELPRNRVTLYRKASEVLLYEWDANRALQADDVFDVEDKQALLRELAGDMQQEKVGLAGNLIERARLVARFKESLDHLGISNSHQKALALVKQLHERNFILAYAGGGFFSFVHRTFLEYFCASWFVYRLQSTRELTLDQLRDQVFGLHWKEEKWQEVLRLIAGMVSEKDAAILVEFLLSKDGNANQLSNLILAVSCLYEVRNRKSIATTEEAVWQMLVDEGVHFNPDGLDHLSQLNGVDDVRLTVLKWIAMAWRGGRAQQWLRSISLASPDHIVRWGAVRELARRWKDDPGTLPWLKTRALEAGESKAEEKAVQEIVFGWKDDPETLTWLLSNAVVAPSDWARRGILDELASGWRDEPDVLPLILNRTRNDPSWFVRACEIFTLHENWREAPEALALYLDLGKNDPSEEVRERVVMVLGWNWMSVPDARALIQDRATNDGDNAVREAAIKVLKRQSGWV